MSFKRLLYTARSTLVKKLVIISTKIIGGKGGIPSALQGYINGLESKSIPYQLVESQNDERAILFTWLSAFWQISLLALKYRKDVVFLVSLGPVVI